MEQQDQHGQNSIPFEFTGTATQFFGIWIVNILLIIITLGVYLPWAKVRTQRFFYGNTLLNDAPFDYLASPLAILKGWAVALAAIIIYNILSEFFPLASLLFLPLIALVTPWIVVRALAFRMRNTAWQNIRFGFTRAYRDAATVFIAWFAVSILSLGLLYPRFRFEVSRFVVTNTGYGKTRFQFHATAKDFYKIYAKAALLPLAALVIIVALAFPQIKQGVEFFKAIQESAEEQADVEETVPAEVPEEAVVVEEAPVAEAVVVDEPVIEGEPVVEEAMVVEESLTEEPLEEEVVNAETPVTEETMIEQPVIEEPVIEETVIEQAPVTREEKKINEKKTNAPDMAKYALLGVAVFFGFIATYMAMFVYIGTRTTNLIYNHTEIAGHRFRSSVRVRDMIWLYLSNLLAISLSFGLLIPWAQVRLARYRASKLVLLPNGSLDHFTQAQAAEVNAIGEEIGEAFDIDVGL